MGALIFFGVLAVLLIIACIIGVIALYFNLKNWVWKEMKIELPPKANPAESYWETTMDDVTPTYVCHSCGRDSDMRYKYCAWCGKKMDNYNLMKR